MSFASLYEVGKLELYEFYGSTLDGDQMFPMLTTVSEGLDISYPYSTSITGFSSLTSVSQLEIEDEYNGTLTDINAFNSLTSLDYFYIGYMQGLTTISGFNSLQSVNEFEIYGNDMLTDVSGFQSINSLINVNIELNAAGTMGNATIVTSLHLIPTRITSTLKERILMTRNVIQMVTRLLFLMGTVMTEMPY